MSRAAVHSATPVTLPDTRPRVKSRGTQVGRHSKFVFLATQGLREGSPLELGGVGAATATPFEMRTGLRNDALPYLAWSALGLSITARVRPHAYR